jgi:ubiquinone/menaquinone biosynthesis C-methylase UbiE
MTGMTGRYVSIAAWALLVGLPGSAAGQLASRPAEQWSETLDRPARLAELKIDDVIARMGLQAGQVVADLGAGTGVFSIPMAAAVGPGGRIYAVDIDDGFFDIIGGKAREAGVANVRTVLGEFGDPKLPAPDVDVAFFHDVLHHIEDRAGYLRNVARYVKPSGRVVVIDLNAETSPHRDQPDLVISEEQVRAWMTAVGFARAERVELFTEKFFVIYSRE